MSRLSLIELLPVRIELRVRCLLSSSFFEDESRLDCSATRHWFVIEGTTDLLFVSLADRIVVICSLVERITIERIDSICIPTCTVHGSVSLLALAWWY